MNHIKKIVASSCLLVMIAATTSCEINKKAEVKTPNANQKNQAIAQPMNLHIIIGSIRPTGTGSKIATNIKAIVDKRNDVKSEIIDIASYNLPFYLDTVSPAQREEEITDPILKKWSDKIRQAQGYIIVSPEYNSGYPASLKNALDSLYKEWNNKPVAFVGYSGGSTGGTSMISQLKEVAEGLEMIPVEASVKIPQSWKAFNVRGGLVNEGAIEKEVNLVVDQLLKAKN